MAARTARTGAMSQQSWLCSSWPLGCVTGQHGSIAARATTRLPLLPRAPAARPVRQLACSAPARATRQRPLAQRPRAQLPSPSVAIQYFCIAIQFVSLTQLPQSRYKNCIVTHCLPSLQYNPPSLQYKLVYCNIKFSSPAFSIAIHYTMLQYTIHPNYSPCQNTIVALQYNSTAILTPNVTPQNPGVR